MAGKLPIDIKRKSALKCTINFPDDGTKIMEMLTLNDTLVAITKKAVYEAKLADQIDPKREKPNLPPIVQQRILGIGTDSELIARVLLTANTLFRKEFFASSIDLKKALSLSYEVLIEMVAMDTIINQYKLDEEKAIEVAKNSKGSFAIPSIGDVKTRCKTFFQKADHAKQTIWDIIRLFYPTAKEAKPQLKEQGHCDTLHNFIKGKYGNDDDFARFIERALPFLKMVRNTRDCLDHRHANCVLHVTDFALLPNGKIAFPAIEIKFRDTNQPSVPLSV